MEVFTHITLVLAVLAAVILSTTCVSVEPPRRISRSHRLASLKVGVSPHMTVMRKGDHIKIKCRARGGIKVEDMPFINFYRSLGRHTILPMSSGFPGVTIETVAASRTTVRSRHNRVVKYMKLGPEVYQTLYPGDNHFYCKVRKMNGDSEAAHFVVHRL